MKILTLLSVGLVLLACQCGVALAAGQEKDELAFSLAYVDTDETEFGTASGELLAAVGKGTHQIGPALAVLYADGDYGAGYGGAYELNLGVVFAGLRALYFSGELAEELDYQLTPRVGLQIPVGESAVVRFAAEYSKTYGDVDIDSRGVSGGIALRF